MVQALAARPDVPSEEVWAATEVQPRGRLRGRSREQERLGRLLTGIRSGRSGVLVVRGEAGIGKTALLEQLVDEASGCVVARATGVQADMELPFAGLQQLFGSMLGSLERLPGPQRDAVEVAFGLRSGPAPDRFEVGLAILGLLAEVAEQDPLMCVVDDAQWLDQTSALTLAFVARRLMAESVALVFAVRDPAEQTFAGLPELIVGGLNDEDARDVLGLAITSRVDDRVIERIVAETRGNPLALIELPLGLSTAELAGGFGVSSTQPLSARLEQSFLGRVQSMPDQTQRFLLLAAAEPAGDPALLMRAAELVGLGVESATPAEAAGLIEIAAQVRFPHPLVRSAIYRAAPLADRQTVHGALADATDAQTDPDRRTWHRAQAALGADEDLAAELERSADRAQARGGLAAAAAFLERAAELTPDSGRRARRALAAAHTKHLAGSPEAALKLLETAASAPMDEPEVAIVQRLRGRIALHLSRSGEAAPLLLDAARRLEPFDSRLARDTHLEALYAASVAGRLGSGMLEAATAARLAPAGPPPPRAVDLLLDGLGVRYTDGSGAAAPILKRALNALLCEDGHYEEDMRWPWLAARVAADLFDDETWHLLATRHLQIARDAGALGALQIALIHVSQLRVFEGRLNAAAALIEETDSIIDATGSRRINVPKLMLAACRGDEVRASALIDEVERDAIARGQGLVLTFGEHARAVLHNGLGHYAAALEHAQRASAQDELHVSVWSLPELVEAAARSGNPELAADALERLRQRTQVAGTEWALGLDARSRALLSDGQVAEGLYREAIDRLGRCRVGMDLARARLLYGEWLRRRARRVDAREQLRSARESFAEMGAGAFAQRAERELLATGETARKRTIETTDDLTPHEARIARMARNGASNQDIATELFVSRKTVEYHLHKVFSKLGISTRQQLEYVLPGT
jgi:DNA-binding CsgD family transcriptional regulator/tetratricopeptide (TPR) repeat protein